MTLIDSEKLKAEIEGRIKSFEYNGGIYGFYEAGELAAYNEIRAFIKSLEKEQDVDLTKEIARFALNGGTGDNTPTIGETARHFYELGLNAKTD